MYVSEKPRPTDVYKRVGRVMMVEPISVSPRMMTTGESSGEDHEMKAPKKRAETWSQDEIRSLINLRREVDALFNTCKSNKHLWEQISAKMRKKGFDRSPNMCTDKWRNLLKEFKRVRCQDGGNGKMSWYKELEELLRNRSCRHAAPAKVVDSYMHLDDKVVENDVITYGPAEGSRPAVNLETQLDHDGDALPIPITPVDPVIANGVPPWSWRETPGTGEQPLPYGGRVISVKWGDYTRRIGIDGSTEAIKEAIKSAFRLRSKRAFWLEDEHQIIRTLDRNMPLGNYTLYLDEGITIKICLYGGADRIIIRTEEKTFYTEEHFHEYLSRRGLTGLSELNNGFRSIDALDDLRPGGAYQGVRIID